MQANPTVEETIYMTKATNICVDKCVKRFGESDLQPPEKTCIDRCAKKYLDLYTSSIQKLGEAGQQMVQQAQSQKDKK